MLTRVQVRVAEEHAQACLRSCGGQEVPAVKSASHLLRCSEVGGHVLVAECSLGSLWELVVAVISCLSSLLPTPVGIH